MDDRDEDDTVSLEGVHPKTSEKKIEEKIEALLSPDARSLFVKIVVAKRAADAKKQKVNVVMLLDRYASGSLHLSHGSFQKFTGTILLYTRRKMQPTKKFQLWIFQKNISRNG